MDGSIKKIDGVFPVTTTKAVYMDGTNKTLQQAIDGGEFGSTITSTTSGRGEAMFILRGGKINIRPKITAVTTLIYSFPTGDSDRLRRMFVYGPASSTLKTIDIPDGVLESHQALVYNVDTNTLETRTTQWGSMSITNSEYVLLFNSVGNISGLLAQYCDYGSDNIGYPIREIEAETISSKGTTQGIFIIDGTVYTCRHTTNDDHSDFDGRITNPSGSGVSHNICHMNAPYYNATKDMLIVGNGSKSFTLAMEGWIFPNWKQTLANAFSNSTNLNIEALDKICLDFSDAVFDDEYKCQLCWGIDSSDYVYLTSSDCRVIRKLQLCSGTTVGTYGNYVERSDGGYNGTYEILSTFRSRTSDAIGGMMYYKGALIFGIKNTLHKHGIRKCILKSDGFFDSEYIDIEDIYGDMQGIALYNNEIYAYTDYRGYKFNLSELGL